MVPPQRVTERATTPKPLSVPRVDVNVYAWQDKRGRWRLLTLPEQRAMFELAAA